MCIIFLLPKAIGNRKRDCEWGCAWGINTTWENLQIEKHKSVRSAEWTPSWLVLFDLPIFSGDVYPQSVTSRTISFFVFPIVFGINLIHFFYEKEESAAGNSIVCFGASIPCHAICQKRWTRNANCFEECNVFTCNGGVNSAPFKRGVRERRAIFWQGKGQNSSPILRCTFWQGKVQNSSPISALLRWRHFRLTPSLCFTLSHPAHLTHNLGTASALPIMCGTPLYHARSLLWVIALSKLFYSIEKFHCKYVYLGHGMFYLCFSIHALNEFSQL